MVRNSGKIKEVIFASSTIKLRNVHFLTVTNRSSEGGEYANALKAGGDGLQ